MVTHASSRVTPTIAAHVLHEYGETGIPPGGFIRSLIAAIGKADTVNKLKIGLGFPGYVEAVDLIQNRSDGIQYLESIVAFPPLSPTNEGTQDGI